MFTSLFRIGKDASVRRAGDTAVCDLSLAYTYGRKGADGYRPTQWIKASLWGKQAEALAPYLTKGSQIVATLDELHIEQREHDGKTYTDLVARVMDVRLMGGASRTSAPATATTAHDDDDIPF